MEEIEERYKDHFCKGRKKLQGICHECNFEKKLYKEFQKRFENNEAMEKMLKEDVSRLKNSNHFKNEEIKRLNKRLEEVATICCKWNAKEIEPLEALHKIWKLDNFCMEKWKELYIERKQLRQKFVKGEKSEV